MSYSDHIEGFIELLDVGCRELTFAELAVSCVISTEGNENQPYDLDPGECQTVKISCFKPDLIGSESIGDYNSVATLPAIGSYFSDDEGGRYRVKARRPNPGRPILKLICEYSGGD
jgi:hypothetical protein